jgi:fructose-1,6-bisphosphatase
MSPKSQMLFSESILERDPVPDSPADLADADALIADLAALVAAGLVVVHEHVLGPARYGLGPQPDDHADGSGRPREVDLRAGEVDLASTGVFDGRRLRRAVG